LAFPLENLQKLPWFWTVLDGICTVFSAGERKNLLWP
jgi:hypothetical protein